MVVDPSIQSERDERAAELLRTLAPALRALANINPNAPPWHPDIRRAGQLVDGVLDALADELADRLRDRLAPVTGETLALTTDQREEAA